MRASGARFASFGAGAIGFQDNGCIKFRECDEPVASEPLELTDPAAHPGRTPSLRRIAAVSLTTTEFYSIKPSNKLALVAPAPALTKALDGRHRSKAIGHEI
jgi:hypothetical protein